MKTVSYDYIERTVRWLHEHPHLPHNPTAGEGRFRLTGAMRNDLCANRLCPGTIEAVARHMAHFLGVPVTLSLRIGIETTETVLLHPSQIADIDRAGYYVSRGRSIEIGVTVKAAFRSRHVLAIIAHELTHAYLGWWDIHESSRIDEEILTDISATYLGLGHLLLAGYQPVVWWTKSEGVRIKHGMTIGYFDADGIAHAIATSAHVRGLRSIQYGLGWLDRLLLCWRTR